MEEEAHALLTWMEAELWQEFIDQLEGMVGESEQVMQARAQSTLPAETCNLWWQWAEEHTPQVRPRSRSRSRSRGEEPDTASFMDTGRGRPAPKQKSYPGRGGRNDHDDEGNDDGRDERGGRGGRREERYSEAVRRRQPREQKRAHCCPQRGFGCPLLGRARADRVNHRLSPGRRDTWYHGEPERRP